MPKIKSTPHGECIFACTKCSERFSTSANLRTHERTHESNETSTAATSTADTDNCELPNICTFCNKRFTRMNELNKHIRIHTGDQSLVCLKCEKIFADHANLRKHQANNMCDLDFKCTECNKRYPSESGLAKHKRVHFFERPYTCEKCPQRFKHSSDLDQHVCNQRSDDCSILNFIIAVDVLPGSSVSAVILNTKEQKEETKHNSTEISKYPFACKQCNYRFSLLLGLRKHELTHARKQKQTTMPGELNQSPHNTSTHTQDELMKRETLADADSQNDAPQLIVEKLQNTSQPIVDKTFLNKITPVLKSNGTYELPVFKCTECDKEFPTEFGYTKHKRIHYFERPYVCRKCPQRFKSSSDLNEHVCAIPLDDCSFLRSPNTQNGIAPTMTALNVVKDTIQRNATEISDHPFVCTQCNYQFSTQSALHEHERTHARKRKLTSEDINEPSLSVSNHANVNLVKHEPVDDDSQNITQSTVGKTFQYETNLAARTANEMGELVFKCSECDKEFPNDSTYNKHKRKHYFERPYVCRKCPQRFKSSSDLKEHVCTVPLDECSFLSSSETQEGVVSMSTTSNVVENASQTASNSVSDDEKPYPCLLCPRRFSTCKSLHLHRRVHSNERQFSCTKCDKHYTLRSTLMNHQRMHTEDYLHACAKCDRRFRTRIDMRKHERAVHSVPLKYPCTRCAETFEDLSKLHRHLHSHVYEHPCVCSECGNKFRHEPALNKQDSSRCAYLPYTCSQCPERFKYLRDLKVHERVSHSGPTKYACNKCGEIFEDLSKLNRHAQVHKRRPFECSECDKKFAHEQALNKHERVCHSGQTKYACNKCGEIFEDLSKLNRHAQVHKRRPFECSECDKKFAHEQALNKHAAMHYFDRPYTCSRCPERFKFSAELKEHDLIHVKRELETTTADDEDCCFPRFSDGASSPVAIKTEIPDSEEDENHSMNFTDSSFENKSVISQDTNCRTVVQCKEECKLSDELNVSNESDRDHFLPQLSEEASSFFIKTEIPDYHEDETTEAMNLTIADIDSAFRNETLLPPEVKPDVSKLTQSCVSFDWDRIKVEPNDASAPAVN